MISFTGKTLLVLAPHADDELACAGTISRATREGASVVIAVIADCDALSDVWRQEFAASVVVLGANPYVPACAAARHLPDKRQRVLDCLLDMRDIIRPDVVLCPDNYDTHQDHEAVHGETVRSFRGVPLLLGYESPWNARRSRSDVFIELNGDDVQARLRAHGCYASQQHRTHMDTDMHQAIMTLRGRQCRSSTGYAEAFELLGARF